MGAYLKTSENQVQFLLSLIDATSGKVVPEIFQWHLQSLGRGLEVFPHLFETMKQ